MKPVSSMQKLIVLCSAFFALSIFFSNCAPFAAKDYKDGSREGSGDPLPAGGSPTQPNPPQDSPSAPSSFVSLHQSPITYVKSSGLDASGGLVFNRTPPLVGFRDQYPPSGTPGCVMGYPEFSSECRTVNGGFGFTFEGVTTNFREYRIYVPAGTTFFCGSGYFPQSQQYAVAVRMGREPTRSAPLTEAEYEQAKLNQNKENDFAKLLAGEERLMVHDGGGNMTMTGIARLANAPLAQGQWIYIRALNDTAIYSLGAIYEVNLDLYRREYNRTSFSESGDP